MSRKLVLVVLALGGLVAGGTCIPAGGVDGEEDGALARAEKLAVAIQTVLADETVAAGDPVDIEWTAGNLTGQPATVTLLVESRTDLTTTVLTTTTFDGTGEGGDYEWITSDFSGAYAIIARITAGDDAQEDQAEGIITVDPPPTFSFTAPTTVVNLDPHETPLIPVTISWVAGDTDGTAEIGIDTDADHGAGAGDDEDKQEDRNETIIHTFTLADPAEPNSIEWDGTDDSGNIVPAGTYYIYAIARDGVNADVLAEAEGFVVVAEAPEEEEEETGVVIAQPEEDAEFLVGGDPLEIEYRLNNSSSDALVDIKIDPDDNHRNGNEITILEQQFVEKDTDPDIFEWNGDDADGNAVDDGIYRIFLAVSYGAGTPQTHEADALVFRRSAEDKPLIALLKPNSVQNVEPGDYVSIEWRDDDPDGEAKIWIEIDDDGVPGGAATEILSGRNASGDGVEDTYNWQVPSLATVPADTYYLIVYIDADDDGTAEHSSSSTAAVVVEDPAAD